MRSLPLHIDPFVPPHVVNNEYQWSASGTAPDGGAFTDFLARVNGTLCATSTCPGLGGHSDWRLPTLAELQTILLATCPGSPNPCIDSAFGPTVPSLYWSASPNAGSPDSAWGVGFYSGGSLCDGKAGAGYVRAVRGGL
jgi:hypothetical protein